MPRRFPSPPSNRRLRPQTAGTAALVLALATVLLGSALISPVVRAERAEVVRTESFRLINEGVSAYNRGDYSGAVESLSTVAAMALNSFRAHYYLGLALIGDRRYGEAIEMLEIALDLDPTHLNAHVNLGNAYLKLGDIDEASAEYYRAMKLRAEYPPALDGLARTAEARADDAKAIEMFRRAIASDQGYAEAYTHLGELYLRQDRLDDAVRLLAEAVSIRPDYAPGLNRLALAYSRLGLENEAVATIRKAIELEPQAASHQSALGHIQLGLGLVETAEKSFARSLELDSGLPDARRGTAEVARRRGDYEAALAEVQVILDDQRTGGSLRRSFEALLESIGQERDRVAELEALAANGDAAGEAADAVTDGEMADQAMNVTEDGQPADGADGDASNEAGDVAADAGEAVAAADAAPRGLNAAERIELAGIYADRRQWRRAADTLEPGAENDDARETLAFYLFQAGRFRDAQSIYAALAQTTPRSDLEVNNGVALTLLGSDSAAIDAYRRALNIDPENSLAQLYLGNALLRLGRSDEAADAYVVFLDRAEGNSEAKERVRRILEQVAPGRLPQKPDPARAPRRPPREAPADAEAETAEGDQGEDA
ncbi:hypothetical protein ABI59_11165 [Acidobacteria bacterium Mor1]|nr:hypothetical protein ABI59_11165 [Acidobacteria bacterium Mor1]